MTYVAPLSHFGRDDLDLAGGKGANLGEMIRLGLPVPEGFVVTTAGYAAAVGSLDLRVAERLQAGDSSWIRADVERVPVPEDLRAEILAAYAGMGGGPVAVRSSATAEDLPGAAFAGQQDTYLNVVGDAALLDAVRRCWGSLWTERATEYRARLGIDSALVRIAVVVQRLVDAEVAGVMLTADPVSGDRSTTVLDASAGLGEAVVSGLVTPDHYLLDGGGRIREYLPGRREVVLRSKQGGGLTRKSGEPSRAEPLPDAVLVELSRLGAVVARHFGRPQDIEWAYAEGRVWLLQARPMTALPPPPLRLNAFQRRMGSILLDYLPVRPYPIDMTTWIPYGPAGLMADVVRRFGIRTSFSKVLPEDEYGVVDRLAPQTPRPTPALLLAPWRILILAHRYDPGRWSEDPRFVAFLARIDELAAQEQAAMTWSQLMTMPQRALVSVTPIRDLRTDYLPGTGLALLRLRLALQVLGRSPLFADLLTGSRTRTSDANRALEALADRAREDPQLAAAVARLDPEVLTGFSDFGAEFGAYLAEYGHRETVSPVLVTTPTQVDTPEAVLGLVAVLAAAPPRPDGRPPDAAAELLAHPLLRGRRRRRIVEGWIRAARAGVVFREDSHFYFLKPLPVLRRSLLEIGRRLRDAGVLADPEDVFHLRLEELEAVRDPAAAAESGQLAAAVRSRSGRRQELAGVRLIDPTAVFPAQQIGEALVSGAAASSGTATGPVRVIREPAEFAGLAAGDVLVCPYTNPAWTPLFQRAAAVVVDSGGVASHAAIVAREYGIPAVMGAGTATSVLTDGQWVTVDGTRGLVSAAPPEDGQR